MICSVLSRYGINAKESTVQVLSSGLINTTWKVHTKGKDYILQKLNDQVFKRPQDIDYNLAKLKTYLQAAHPDYLFVAPLQSRDGKSLIDGEDGYFRLFAFVEGSHTVDSVNTPEEAYEAARQFGKFSRLLADFDADQLTYPLPDFHNLTLRYKQFLKACDRASAERKSKSDAEIQFIKEHAEIADTYENILKEKALPYRVIHHDTKISNVLFDHDQKGLCVIDLDTVMPGLYISDVGDMMRTYLSPANEEETDPVKISIRPDYFKAIYQGYMSEMGPILSEAEKAYFVYSGEFIIYMQAIRFLTDYLNEDIYYGARYPEHNLNRAINQITLLTAYLKEKEHFKLLTSKA